MPVPPAARQSLIASSKALRVVVRGFGALRLAGAHAVVDAGVDQRVVHDEIAALRQRREQRHVGHEAAAEEQRALGAEEGGGLRLQRLVLGMVAAQQPRAAGADRHAARERRLRPRRASSREAASPR